MNDEHDAMVADCEARESRLTEWEQGFVQSMREHLDARRSLTDKQVETLDRIWTRATSKG